MAHKEHKHSFFISGPVTPEFIAAQIGKHSSKTDIGGHTIFLGQVRKDNKNGKNVREIIYSAYPEMAEKAFQNIKENVFEKYDVRCLHIFHSTGSVKTGEISLFVFLSGKHREGLFSILQEIVDDIKLKVPIWKKEIYEDETYAWIE